MDEDAEISDAAGGPPSTKESAFAPLLRQIITSFVRFTAFIAILGGVMLGLGLLPRNPDHSIRFAYYGPTFAAVGLVSFVLLKSGRLLGSPARLLAWMLLIASVLFILVGGIQLAIDDLGNGHLS